MLPRTVVDSMAVAFMITVLLPPRTVSRPFGSGYRTRQSTTGPAPNSRLPGHQHNGMVSDATNGSPTASPDDRPEVLDRVATALGQPVLHWERPECGLSAAERWITGLADGTSVFVKSATDAETTDWLTNERNALLVAGDRFGPAVIDWLDGQP